MSDHVRDPSEDLAQWLMDVGHRTWRPQPAEAGIPRGGAGESREDLLRYIEELAGRELNSRGDVRDFVGKLSALGHASRRRQVMKDTVLLLALLTAFIQYYLLDVSLQIARMPSTLVFVPVEMVSSPLHDHSHAFADPPAPFARRS